MPISLKDSRRPGLAAHNRARLPAHSVRVDAQHPREAKTLSGGLFPPSQDYTLTWLIS